MVEQLTCNQQVGGSIPLAGSTRTEWQKQKKLNSETILIRELLQVILDGQDQRTRINERTGNDIVAKENSFYFETLCEYKRPDGTRGWILTVKPKPKEEK